MKKLFFVLVTLLTICSCSKIDPEKVNAEITISRVDADNMLCSGHVGGFTGDAYIAIKDSGNIKKRQSLHVTGESTSFSFTFSDYATSLRTYDVIIYEGTIRSSVDNDKKIIFRSSVVVKN